MIAFAILIMVVAAFALIVGAVVKVRGATMGFEVGPTLLEGPYLFKDVAAAATMTGSLVGDISHPSFLEVSIAGGTDNSGDVIVTGIINGASFTETFTFTGPGGGTVTKKGALLFTSVTAVTTTGLVGEAAEATVTLRVSDRVTMNYMDETIPGKQAILTDEGSVRARDSTQSSPGTYDIGGDYSLRAGPENGLGELFTAAYGAPTLDVANEAVNGPAFTTPETFTQPRQVVIRILTITGTDIVTVSGDVNGTPDTDVIPVVDTVQDYITIKSFDDVTGIVFGAGITAHTETFHEAISYDYRWKVCDTIDPFFFRFAKDFYEREVQGLKITKMEIGAATNDWVVATASTKGRTELVNPVPTRSFSNLINFVFHQGILTRNASTYNLAMELTIGQENTLKDRDTFDGTRFMNDRTAEGSKGNLDLKLKFGGQAEYERFLGDVGDLEPQDVLTPQAIVATFTSHQVVFGTTPYSLSVNMPRAYFREFSEPVKARDALEVDAKIYLEKDATLVGTHEISLVSSVIAY